MKKKTNYLLSFILICVIIFLFLPQEEKAMVPHFPLPELETSPEVLEMYKSSNNYLEEKLELYTHFADKVFTGMVLDENTLEQLASIFTSYEMLVNKSVPSYSVITTEDAVMIEINKYISSYLANTEIPQLNTLYTRIKEDLTYQQLTLYSNHVLHPYYVDEAHKQGYVLYAEKAVDLIPSGRNIQLNLSQKLESKLDAFTLTKHFTIYEPSKEKSDESFYYELDDESLQLKVNSYNFRMMQRALQLVAPLYPDQQELANYIQSFSTYSAFILDAQEIHELTSPSLDLTSQAYLVTILDNPYIPMLSTETFISFAEDFFQITSVQSQAMLANHYEMNPDEAYWYRIYSLPSQQELTVHLTEQLKERLSLSSKNISFNRMEVKELADMKEEYLQSNDLTNDYFQQMNTQFFELAISKHQSEEQLKLILNGLNKSDQLAILEKLLDHSITINNYSIKEVYSPNSYSNTYARYFSIKIKQGISSFLLNNEASNSLLEEKLLDSDGLKKKVTEPNLPLKELLLEDGHSKEIIQISFDQSLKQLEKQQLFIFDKEFLGTDEGQIFMTNTFNYHNNFYFPRFFQQDALYYLRNEWLTKEITLLQQGLMKGLELSNVVDTTTLLTDYTTYEQLKIFIDDEAIELTEKEYPKASTIRLEVTLTNPYFLSLPKTIVETYLYTLMDQFVTSTENQYQNKNSNYFSTSYNQSTLVVNVSLFSLINDVDVTFGPLLVDHFAIPYETIKFKK